MSTLPTVTSSTSFVATSGDDFRYILASGSQRRRDIMALAGMVFVVQHGTDGASEISGDDEPDVLQLTRQNAEKKLNAALAAARNRMPWNTVVIAADTGVSLHGRALGKPTDREMATGMLRDLRGRQHDVVTTVALTYSPHRQRGEVLSHTVTSKVEMRDYDDDEIGAYLATGTPYDRAGAYGVQDAEFDPAKSVVGCYLNVVGLPLCAVRALLPENARNFVHAHVYATCAAHEERAGA